MLTPAELDALILQLYDHASDASMDPMLASLPAAFRSMGVHSILLDSRGTVIEASVSDLQIGAPREYEQAWRDADPRMALASGHPGKVFSDVQHIDPAAFERSDIYHAVMRPWDLRYSLFGNMPLSNGYIFARAAMRSRSVGPYDEAEVAAMVRLGPHLRRALDLRIELRTLRTHVADLTSALDALPSPVFVLDAAGRILHHNASANTLLASREGLATRQERLVTRDPRTTSQLLAAVKHASSYADQPSSSRHHVQAPTLAVDVARDGKSALLLVVHPLRPRAVLRSITEERARALVIVHDPHAGTRVDRSLLERTYALTPTEAELAASLAEGKSLTDYAAARGCAEATARTHLKRVFEKTGTHRQAELVHRVLASAALHAVEH